MIKLVPSKIKLVPSKWYIATYGDMGITVEFFTNKRLYERMVREAERSYEDGDIDSYTCGDSCVERQVGTRKKLK